jgi:murein DD-endopeptidase MepM/ murein hydrolase activator NlpD
MSKKEKNKIYFYYDDKLQIHEVKRYRLRMIGTSLLSLAAVVGVFILINHFANDILGIEHDKMSSLVKENRMLQQQLSTINAEVKQLQSNIDSVDRQGDVLRLMVDLPQLDQETKSAGVGGAVMQAPLASFSDRASEMLQSVAMNLTHLKSEMAVQQQSYQQIVKKTEYNKGFFASLPALKPMEGYYSKTGFGLRMHPVLGIFKTHEGLDIINDVGTPVCASGDGTIEVAGQSEGGYGIMIVITHGYGYQTLYAHLSKVLVKEGQHVKRGDIIARSGRTGLVTGPHLHYEVRHNGVSENPINFFFDDITPQEYRTRIASK